MHPCISDSLRSLFEIYVIIWSDFISILHIVLVAVLLCVTTVPIHGKITLLSYIIYEVRVVICAHYEL